MRPEIFARWLSGFLLLAAALVPPAGLAQVPAPPRASGKITALIPLDFVLREQKSLDAKKDMPVFFRVQDRKSTRLNSSHRCISYAVFCLKKKKKKQETNKYTQAHTQESCGRERHIRRAAATA